MMQNSCSEAAMHVRIIRTGPSILRHIVCEERLSEARALANSVARNSQLVCKNDISGRRDACVIVALRQSDSCGQGDMLNDHF